VHPTVATCPLSGKLFPLAQTSTYAASGIASVNHPLFTQPKLFPNLKNFAWKQTCPNYYLDEDQLHFT